MPDTFRCPRGHEWRPTEGTDATGPPCPECGAAGELTPETIADGPVTGDELPPPPGTQIGPPGWSGPSASLEMAPAIEGYEIGEEVGRGGMAVVYRVRQRSLNRSVALKVMLPGGGHAEGTRIRAEAEAIARLQHPNIVHVYEVGEQGGCPYLLMEFVDGGTLADRLRGRPVPPIRAAAWAEAIARGVHAAHRRRVVHRDLKPSNVLMTADEVPKISDFGIARQLDGAGDTTRTGVVMGTPAYMAPEQAQGKGKSAGPAADVWAVGVILYEMLTGRTPFSGESSFEVLRQVVLEPPIPPSRLQAGVPPRLEAVCLKCLQKRPEDRYPSAEALADDLARCLADRDTTARPATRRWVIPAAVGIGLVLVAVIGVGLTGGRGGPGPGSGVGTSGGPDPSQPESRPAENPGGVVPPIGQPTWERFQIGEEDEGYQQLAFPTRDTGFAASRTGVYRTDDGGRTWPHKWPQDLGAVHFLTFEDADRGWVGTNRLFHTTNGGKNWDAVPLAGVDRMAAVRAVAFGPAGWGLAGGASESGELVLFRRRDAAAGWEKLDPAAAGLWGGADAPYRGWFLGGLAVSGPRDAWAALFGLDTEKGVLLHTADGGGSWKTVLRVDTYLRHVHFADARRGWATGFRGGIWRTEDGGTTWVAQRNPVGDVTVSCLAFARSGEPVAIAPLWKGLVLWTDDGQSWRTVETGLEYATPAAAVVDRGRAYVLGTDGRLARYTDPRVTPRR